MGRQRRDNPRKELITYDGHDSRRRIDVHSIIESACFALREDVPGGSGVLIVGGSRQLAHNRHLRPDRPNHQNSDTTASHAHLEALAWAAIMTEPGSPDTNDYTTDLLR